MKVSWNSSATDRFWAKVNKNGPQHPTLGKCWSWSGYPINGYGVLETNGKLEGSHRVSWKIHNGAIPDGLFVLHKCDNRACVNPAHLFLGSQKENLTDMVRKNRQNKGEARPLAKLTEKSVREIRKLYRYRSKKSGIHALAKRFGVAPITIYKVVSNFSWRHVK